MRYKQKIENQFWNDFARITFTKELFIETINQIEIQYRHDQKCGQAFQVILPNDHISFYDNHNVSNQLFKILQIAMNDNHEHSWIEYFMWEIDFGKKWKKGKVKIGGKDFKLKTSLDLWNLLNIEI